MVFLYGEISTALRDISFITARDGGDGVAPIDK